MSETNGSAPPEQTDPTAPPAPLNAAVRPVLGIMVAGLATTFPGIPVPMLFMTIAREMGFTLGMSLMADKINQQQIRHNMRKFFREGLDAAPGMDMPAAAPAEAETAVKGT